MRKRDTPDARAFDPDAFEPKTDEEWDEWESQMLAIFDSLHEEGN